MPREGRVKLNLGCGAKRAEGWVNVDKYPALAPDMVHDLEALPWPWADNSVSEVLMAHVLEHLGQSTEVFLGIMAELYRICRPGAVIHVVVPHPRHDDFINDPTHVRPITPEVMSLFDRQVNLEWQRTGAANSQLALALGVDFVILHVELVPTKDWLARVQRGEVDQAELAQAMSSQNNVIREIGIRLTVRKDPAPGA